MEEKSPTGRSLLTRLRIFYRLRPLASWLIIIGGLSVFSVIFLVSVSVVGYMAFDYTQNTPEFCVTCHVPMQEAYDTWQVSEHAEVNCHTCHHLSPEEAVNYGIYILRGLPGKIPPRHEGETIVPSKICMDCHWEEQQEEQKVSLKEMDITEMVLHAGQEVRAFLTKTGPDGVNVTSSRYHAIHYFNGQTECLACHGKKELHVFTAEDPAACLDCHEDRQEKLHAAKGVEHDCLSCHTDRTADLVPDREKCLSCHAEDGTVRQELAAEGTFDVKHAKISEETIAQAIKIALPEGAPMQNFACSTCHTPHQDEAKPSVDVCADCHPRIGNVGQHALHLKFVGGDCIQCHQAHSWTITEERAQEECIKCHEYYEPLNFIQARNLFKK